MSSSKAAIDDIDNLPDAATPPAGSRKKARTIIWQDSQLCLYRYHDEFCGDSIWLHCDLHDIDRNGCFKPEFSALGKVVGNSDLNNVMLASGLLLRLPGFCLGWLKIPEGSAMWGSHRIRVLGQTMAKMMADFTRPHLEVQNQTQRSAFRLSSFTARVQGTTFAADLTLMDDDLDDEAPEVQAYYIPGLDYRHILEVFKDGKMVPVADSDRFVDLAGQKAFFVKSNTMLFKEAVYKKFPGGAFAKIDTVKPKLGSSCRQAGSLWQAPAFNLSDLVQYFEGFGCKVTVSKLDLSKV
jgi:hypothetical protein